MSEKNYLNETVVPRMPKSVSNEQLFVFVPVASGAVAGILKINDTDFYKNRLPELKIIESGTLDSTNKPYYNPLGYVRAGIIKAYVDDADKALKDSIDLKQDINLSKSIADATTVEGALINLDSSTKDLKTRMTRAEGKIDALENADEGLANRINNLEQSAYVGETPIGTYPSGATLPTQEQLTAFVQQEVSREPKLGDVVLFTQIVADGTDKSYKFMYTETGWSNYVVSILEKLSNTPGTSDTDGYTQKAVNGIVQNPNLLINPNFAINQRGKSEYTTTAKTYTVDRTASNRSVITPLQGGGIKFNVLSGQSNPYLQQVIENATPLVGEQLTFSAKVDGVVYSHTITTVVPSANSTTAFYDKTFHFGSYLVGLQLVKYKPQSNPYPVLQVTWTFAQPNNTIINWWKLEIGSVATPFSPPSIAEELEKCQRYYIDIGRNGATSYLIGSGVFYNATLAYVIIPIPTTLRKAPTLILGDLTRLTLLGDGKSYTPTDITLLGTNNNSVSLRYSVTGATAGNGCAARLVNSENNNNNIGIIAFDAEI